MRGASECEGAMSTEHPSVVRLCHWAFALAIAVLIGSGLEVFAAFPDSARRFRSRISSFRRPPCVWADGSAARCSGTSRSRGC